MTTRLCKSICFGVAALLCMASLGIAQDDVTGVTVFIQCTQPDGGAISGTGVLVGHDGYVLTANHVLGKEDSVCRGSPGVADPGATKLMIRQPPPIVGLDAALLQFSEQVDYPFVTYCSVENWMIRKPIVVAGFPGKTQTGAASFRSGILSTVRGTPKGVIETDGQTAAGMSGGPVFTKDLKSLIGIVIGAQFDNSGVVTYYGILPVAKLALQLGLTESSAPCFHKTREVEFEPGKNQWRGGDAVPLGVSIEDGVCFLATVTGQFNDKADSVGVVVRDGQYELGGENHSGGQHAATARCMWYE